VTAGAFTAVQFDHVAFDSDNTFLLSNHGANIVTQGYYKVEACVEVEILASKFNIVPAFAWSPSSNNPYFANGPLFFGYRGIDSSVTGSAAGDNSVCISAITPYPMYPTDLLSVVLYVSATATVDINQNTSFTQGRFSTQFTGRWIREGT
jgi:hypothetical protein